MTREETKTVLTVLRTTYPNFYKTLNLEDQKGMLDIWCELFQDDDVKLVKIALKQLILTSKYPPAISEIKEVMYSFINPNKMNIIEAFSLVKKACRIDGTLAMEQFDMLPLEIQKTIRSHTTLQDWAVMNENDLETIAYARFRDMYKQTLNEMKINAISPLSQIEMKKVVKIEKQ